MNKQAEVSLILENRFAIRKKLISQDITHGSKSIATMWTMEYFHVFCSTLQYLYSLYNYCCVRLDSNNNDNKGAAKKSNIFWGTQTPATPPPSETDGNSMFVFYQCSISHLKLALYCDQIYTGYMRRIRAHVIWHGVVGQNNKEVLGLEWERLLHFNPTSHGVLDSVAPMGGGASEAPPKKSRKESFLTPCC